MKKRFCTVIILVISLLLSGCGNTYVISGCLPSIMNYTLNTKDKTDNFTAAFNQQYSYDQFQSINIPDPTGNIINFEVGEDTPPSIACSLTTEYEKIHFSVFSLLKEYTLTPIGPSPCKYLGSDPLTYIKLTERPITDDDHYDINIYSQRHTYEPGKTEQILEAQYNKNTDSSYEDPYYGLKDGNISLFDSVSLARKEKLIDDDYTIYKYRFNDKSIVSDYYELILYLFEIYSPKLQTYMTLLITSFSPSNDHCWDLYVESNPNSTSTIPTNNDTTIASSSTDGGLSIQGDCLEKYLSYIASGKAASTYKKNHDGFNYSDQLQYFSICGMADDHTPFLLLSSSNDNSRNGDKINYILYENKSDDVSGLTDYKDLGFENYECLSMRQAADRVGVYLINNADASSNTRKCPFMFNSRIHYFADPEWGFEESYDFVSQKAFITTKQNGSHSIDIRTESETDFLADSYLESGTVSEIKWFSTSDIDAARAYYSQFIK